jgi:TIR domain-containing protein
MTGIFINYRREDTSAYAGRLYDLLVTQFGRDRVFMDIDAIGPGEDFRTVIEQTCSACEVVLAVMGKSWATVCDKSGKIRLQNETDFVRLEIASALAKGIRVIPVLVGGAEMPEISTLPTEIQSLAFRNAWEISDRRFHQDAQGLVEALQKILQTKSSKRLSPPRHAVDAPPPATESANHPGPNANVATERPVTPVQEMSFQESTISATSPPASGNTEITDSVQDAKPDAASPTTDITKRQEALLAEQRVISGAILRKWLKEGSRAARDKETERLLRRSDEVQKELRDLKRAEAEGGAID